MPPLPESPEKTIKAESDEVNGDKRVLTRVVRERIKTLKDLVRVCEIDTSEWEVERYVVNKWEGFSVPRTTRSTGTGKWVRPSAEPKITELFQVKAWMKLRRAMVAALEEIEGLRKKADAFSPIYPALKLESRSASGNLVEFSITDHHFGALIWGKETGGADYDSRIAKECYEKALTALLERTQPHAADEALVVLGNDQQNSDNRANTTEHGTPQDSDSRYQRVFSVSRDASIWAIEALLGIAAKVSVVVVPGNHDYLSSWHLGDTLQSWFRRCDRVKVDNSPSPRKYREHGVCMLMYTHGNAGKLEQYPATMAAEQPEMWGRTRWREAHTGDKHHRRVIECRGATVRILPSLRPPDAWSSEHHFVGSVRAAEAFVWNAEEGLIGTAAYSVL